MGKEDRIQHGAFRHLLCACFDHHDRLFRSRYRQVHYGLFSLLQSWVDDKFAVYHAYTNRTGRAIPWNIGNRQCYRRTDHCHNIRLAVRIHRHYRGNDDNIVKVSFGNSGRKGLSISLEFRIALSLGLPSRFIKPPGIFPAAYILSS